jgi:hypothetical protein
MQSWKVRSARAVQPVLNQSPLQSNCTMVAQSPEIHCDVMISNYFFSKYYQVFKYLFSPTTILKQKEERIGGR